MATTERHLRELKLVNRGDTLGSMPILGLPQHSTGYADSFRTQRHSRKLKPERTETLELDEGDKSEKTGRVSKVGGSIAFEGAMHDGVPSAEARPPQVGEKPAVEDQLPPNPEN